MSHTVTIRLPDDLAVWLAETSRQTGMPAGRIVRQQLQKAKSQAGVAGRKFLRHAGKIDGPANLSARKGFSRA